MTNGFDEMILNMTDTTPEPEDYTGEDGLLYCGKCHKPKEGYFPKETAVIRQIKRCLFRQIKTGLSEHLTMG